MFNRLIDLGKRVINACPAWHCHRYDGGVRGSAGFVTRRVSQEVLPISMLRSMQKWDEKEQTTRYWLKRQYKQDSTPSNPHNHQHVHTVNFSTYFLLHYYMRPRK